MYFVEAEDFMGASSSSPSTHDDREVVEEALLTRGTKPLSKPREVYLGEKELKIWLDLVKAYQELKAPLPSDLITQIVKKHLDSKNPHVMLNNLEKKGVLQSSEEKSSNRSRIPLTRGLRIIAGSRRKRRQVWPEVVSETISTVKLTSEESPSSTCGVDRLLPYPTSLGEGKPYVVSVECEPSVLTKQRFEVYQTLMSFARANNYRLLNSKDIRSCLRSVNANPSVMFYFEHKFGLTYQVSGTPRSKSDPLLRAVVFAPYIIKGDDNVHIPDECHLLSKSDDTSELKLVSETESVDPSTQTVISTGRLRSKEELQYEFDEIDRKIKQAREKALAQIVTDYDSLIKQQETHVESLKKELEKAFNELKALTDQSKAIAGTVISDQDAGVEDLIKYRERVRVALEHHDVLVDILLPSMCSTD